MLQSELNKLEMYSYNSAGNFLLLRLPGGMNSDLLWQHMILDHRMVLRNCRNYEGLGDGYLRVAVRTKLQNDAFVKALGQTLSKCRIVSSTVA